MQIELPIDAATFARTQAEAAGFASVDEYVTNLIRRREPCAKLSREAALEDLRKLRAETPKMTTDEMVAMVAEARAELP